MLPPTRRSRCVLLTAALALAPVLVPTGAHASTRTVATPHAAAASYALHIADWNIAGILNDTKKNPPWSTRAPIVASDMLGLTPSDEQLAPPDAISVQEANTSKKFDGGKTQYSDLVSHLNAAAPSGSAYKAVGGTPNATHLIYNSDTLTLVKYGHVKWHAQETKDDGYRYFPWAILKVKATGARFFFASAHLETENWRVRNKQWAQLLRIVPGKHGLSRGYPVVIGGDFNSTRRQKTSGHSAVTYLPKMHHAGFGDTLGQGSFGAKKYYGGTPNPFPQSRSRAKSLIRADANTVNPHWTRNLGHEGKSTNVGRGSDYIFASNRLKVTQWALVADYTVDGSKYVLNTPMPSDHNLLRATITLPTP